MSGFPGSGWRPNRPGPGPRLEIVPPADQPGGRDLTGRTLPLDRVDDARLLGLQRCWKRTGNPLFVFVAIHRCLNLRPSIALPSWCLEYLAAAASTAHELFLDTETPADEAHRRMLKALGFGQDRGERNPFVTLRTALDGMHDAVEVHGTPPSARGKVVGEIASRRNRTEGRQRKVLAEARDMIGRPGDRGRPPQK